MNESFLGHDSVEYQVETRGDFIHIYMDAVLNHTHGILRVEDARKLRRMLTRAIRQVEKDILEDVYVRNSSTD